MMRLEHKHILLGVTGSIAAYKVPELIRMLQKQGATVQVMVTKSALNFVSVLTLEVISGFPVLRHFFDGMTHIHASRRADLVLIVPATAHTLAQFAYGMAGNLVSASVLASKSPVMIAPAMNTVMWNHQLVQQNIRKLRQVGYHVVEPDDGFLACGEIGEGRLADLSLLEHEIIRLLTFQDLRGKKILITAGATREYLDPVRFLSNASTGKMAYALAEEAYYRGATVTVFLGAVDIDFSSLPISLVKVTSVQQMLEALMLQCSSADIFIAAAAVCDYAVKTFSSEKIKKEKKDFVLRLLPALDIVEKILTLKKRPYVIGFSLETEHVLSFAKKKFLKKPVDLLVANSDCALGADGSKVFLLSKHGVQNMPFLSKSALAGRIFDHVISYT